VRLFFPAGLSQFLVGHEYYQATCDQSIVPASVFIVLLNVVIFGHEDSATRCLRNPAKIIGFEMLKDRIDIFRQLRNEAGTRSSRCLNTGILDTLIEIVNKMFPKWIVRGELVIQFSGLL